MRGRERRVWRRGGEGREGAGRGGEGSGGKEPPYQARVQGLVRGVRTHPCSSSWSLLCICIKQHRCGYHSQILYEYL